MHKAGDRKQSKHIMWEEGGGGVSTYFWDLLKSCNLTQQNMMQRRPFA
jgi:hypothetical protein